MKSPVVVVGIGQLGGVFAKGFLALGHPVYPVTRRMDMNRIEKDIPVPEFVLIAVPEKSLHEVLKTIPDAWKGKTGLLQNEILPFDWKNAHLENPTVMAVWFEKKKDMDVHIFQTTPVFGPYSEVIVNALNAVEIPARILPGEKDLLVELVKKNLYVLTINIAGLKVGGTVGELWKHHPDLVRDVANEVLDVQEALVCEKFDRDKMMDFLIHAFDMAPDHKCAGRVAGERRERLLRHAHDKGVFADTIKGLH